MAVTAGLVLDGKYRLISELGEGGMGTVWRAEDLRLDAPVAVKLMHAHAASSPEARARFVREAKATANLRSPHVVQVFDSGVDEATHSPYLVMELLEGESLRDRLARVGPMPAREVSRIVTHVARALVRAHEASIVHRDLKPANIFLVRNADSELAKVLDFGVAKWAAQPLLGLATQTGTFLGTPYYMSLEQIACSKDIDYRSDLWSLAVIAVECMTGRLPFAADNLPALALQIAQNRATPPSRLGPVPDGFDAWFERATAAHPADRFASAAEQAQALRVSCEADPRRPDSPIALQRTAARPTTSPSIGPLSRTSTFAAFDGSGRSPSRKWKWLGALVLVGGAWIALERARPSAHVEGATPGTPIESTAARHDSDVATPVPTSLSAASVTTPASAPREPQTALGADGLPPKPAEKRGEEPKPVSIRAMPKEATQEERDDDGAAPSAPLPSNVRPPRPISRAERAASKPRSSVRPNQPREAPRQPQPVQKKPPEQKPPAQEPPAGTPPSDDLPSAFEVPI
jgi:serine/threonine protein kinase